MKTVLIVIAVVAVVALIGFGQVMGTRNGLVTSKQAIDGAWAQVDVSLQRRADLIPNLVETVKGFAKQEQTVIDSVLLFLSKRLGRTVTYEEAFGKRKRRAA